VSNGFIEVIVEGFMGQFSDDVWSLSDDLSDIRLALLALNDSELVGGGL
jgi:hypothetical protein